MFVNVTDRERRIFGSLCQPSLETIESAGEPGIMLAHTIHAQRDEIAREQLGQRRCHCFQQRTLSHKVQIFVHRVPSRGQHLALTDDALRVQPSCFREFDPAFDTTVLGVLVAVMVDDTLAPCPPKFRSVAAREK
jgi:hypothetical protein